MKNERWPYGVGWETDGDLLPCPFCGGVAVIATVGNDYSRKRGFDVKCSMTDCRFGRSDRIISQTHEWLRPKVIDAWNRRNHLHP